MSTAHQSRAREEAEIWAARAPHVDANWFAHVSVVHGVSHTQRVHVHVQRLAGALGWGAGDTDLALCAALWHDIGRLDDGIDPEHGARSVARIEHLGLSRALTPAEKRIVHFAVRYHPLPDNALADTEETLWPDAVRAVRVLWLLKDADALDRVRLGWGEAADPQMLRHEETRRLLPFAGALYAALGP